MISGVTIINIELSKNEILCVYFCSGESIAINSEDGVILRQNNLVEVNKNPYKTLKDFRNNKIIFNSRDVTHIIVKEKMED